MGRKGIKKIVVVGDDMTLQRNDDGITTMRIYDFLLKDNMHL